MSGVFDDFLTDCIRDCVDGYPQSTTTEPTHTHLCPVCDSSWVHASLDCEAVYPNKTWARCPFHEGRDE